MESVAPAIKQVEEGTTNKVSDPSDQKIKSIHTSTTEKQVGPFGLEMGISLAELSKQMKLNLKESNVYTTMSVPKSHKDFDNYQLIITPAHGLCKVIAFSLPIRTSVYGTELVSKFTSIEEVLSAKYGTPERFDFSNSGSIWNESRDWMMGLVKKERSLMTFWLNTKLELPNNISTIKLDAVAANTELAMVILTYEFINVNQCINWIKSQDNSAL